MQPPPGAGLDTGRRRRYLFCQFLQIGGIQTIILSGFREKLITYVKKKIKGHRENQNLLEVSKIFRETTDLPV